MTVTADPLQQIRARVKTVSTAQLREMHAITRRQMREITTGGYTARRPHSLVLLAIESEMTGRGIDPPSRREP